MSPTDAANLVPYHPTPPATMMLHGDVIDDQEAIRVFLHSYSRRSAHTVRAYEKECRRFLLWMTATHDPSPALLPSATVQDINDYLDFLSNPRPFQDSFLATHGWDHQPFRKGLATESVKHSITILHRMFDALRNLRAAGNLPYCLFNPVVLAHDGIASARGDDEIEEALTCAEWEAVQTVIEELPRESPRDIRHYHRARWVMQLLYRAFLRRDEAAQLKMGDFDPVTDGWNIRLIGKGSKKAKIVATSKLMAELQIYRASLGLPLLPSPGETRPAILTLSGKDKGVSDQTIYLLCRTIFERAAERIEADNPASAQRLHKASPHWMRHTGITHAMESGVDPRYVQAQARHASLNMTARYDHKERSAWRVDLERM